MDFPPNYEAAIWFIDEIFPRIRARRPATTFSVAGANPVPALRKRSGDGVEILGNVPDMSAVLASAGLYVAPLVSGGGFKNKIIEAIACGAFVVSTLRGVEFLDPGIRDLLLIGDSAATFADRVLEFLDRPAFYDARVPLLRARVNEEYSWSRRAGELLDLIRDVTPAQRT
jgi:glycosyltransferase involved in cell wall biosynthesis